MRDPLLFSYLSALGYSPRQYHAFAVSLGLAKPRRERLKRILTPTTSALPAVLTAMRRLERAPSLVNPEEHTRACRAVQSCRRALSACTKTFYPKTYRAERRKATRALHHALAYRDALAYSLNEITPGTVPVQPTPKARPRRAPGEAQRLASLRYTLRNVRASEPDLMVAYEEARTHANDLDSRYASISADLYIARQEAEQELSKRRVEHGPNVRRPKGSGAAIKALAAQAREARGELRTARAKATKARARLARARQRITNLEKNIFLIVSKSD